MASHRSGILFAFIMVVVCHSRAEGAVNLRCSKLEKVFPSCPCLSAEEEKGAVYAIVDCSNKGLSSVPTIQTAYTDVIYKLVLKGNIIKSLTDNSFQGLKVEYLDLSGNGLSSVTNDTFASMKDSLRTLEIEGDSNSLPPINALNKLNMLETLYLRNYNVPFMDTHYFLSFTKLRSLTLDTWKTEHIESDSFAGLSNLRKLVLLNQKLSSLPLEPLRHDPLPQLETLKISNTQITSVTDSIFERLTSLKNLDLSNNKIDTLEDKCFSGVEDTLEDVNFHGNLLNNDNNAKLTGLSGLTILKKLDLSYNTFKKIPSMPNLGPTQPFQLLLNDNEINEVQDNAFRGYAQYLDILDLNGNYIRAMNPNAFTGVQLSSFHLTDPKGPSSDPILVPISLIDSASTLKTVRITGHRVDSNTLWPVIAKLKMLKELNLKSTELSAVPDLTFQDLSALEQLDLSFNTLSILSQESLVGLRNLKTLDLEGNAIKTIPSCLFHEFDSPQITLNLGINPIKCDCKIKQLLKDIESGAVVFDSSSPPRCIDDNQLLTSKNPEKLVCNPPFVEKACESHYTTSAPTTSEPATIPQIEITILEAGTSTVKASWTITDDSSLQKYKFEVRSSIRVPEFTRDNLQITTKEMLATGLPKNTQVTICVTAFFTNRNPISKCVVNKTKADDDTNSEKLEDDDSDSATTGIIVGCVVAGVALIGVVVAIIILLVVRKKPKNIQENNNRTPMPPRHFGKAELPTMADDTRSFKKVQKNGKGPHKEGMQVVAISDGQTSPGARVGRANMMFEPEDGYEPMDHFKKKSQGGSIYENDHGALPPTPGQNSLPPSYPDSGYYNQAFRDDKYDQVEVEL